VCGQFGTISRKKTTDLFELACLLSNIAPLFSVACCLLHSSNHQWTRGDFVYYYQCGNQGKTNNVYVFDIIMPRKKAWV